MLGAVAALLALESQTPLFRTQPAPPPPQIDPVYQWLAEQPRPFPFAELPLGPGLNSEQRYQYASTWHWQPMLNGSMGVTPIVHAYMRSRLAEPPTLATLAELRDLGLDHVLLHAWALPKALREPWVAFADAHPEALIQRYASGRSVVYAIGEVPEQRWHLGAAIPRDDWTISGSEANATAGLAIDDSEATTWRSWADLERRLRRWYAPDSFPESWLDFLGRQPSHLTLDLGRPTPLGAAVLRLGHSDPEIVGLLHFAVSEDGIVWQPVDTQVRVAAVRQLVSHGSETPLAFVFPPDTVTRHLRVSGHGIDWEVADLQLHHPTPPAP
jgi:hypothetical protein